jgi:hypothetical protein
VPPILRSEPLSPAFWGRLLALGVVPFLIRTGKSMKPTAALHVYHVPKYGETEVPSCSLPA